MTKISCTMIQETCPFLDKVALHSGFWFRENKPPLGHCTLYCSYAECSHCVKHCSQASSSSTVGSSGWSSFSSSRCFHFEPGRDDAQSSSARRVCPSTLVACLEWHIGLLTGCTSELQKWSLYSRYMLEHQNQTRSVSINQYNWTIAIVVMAVLDVIKFLARWWAEDGK